MSTPTSFGTLYSSLIRSARLQFAAGKFRQDGITFDSDPMWSDDELFGHAKRGTTDLWKAVIDLHHEHFLTLNNTDVTLPSGNNAQSGVPQLSGVPRDTFRVYLIESTTVTNAVIFKPRAANHRDFIAARWQGMQAPVSVTQGQIVYYCLTGAGAPQSAPIVLTAPALSSALSLNFWYIPVLDVRSYQFDTATNPIPGESDQALICWIIAHALAKEGQQGARVPDPGWMALYGTEKANLLTSLTPRQEQEAEYVDSVFGD